MLKNFQQVLPGCRPRLSRRSLGLGKMQIYRLVANSIRVSDFGRNSKPITWVIINVNVVGVAHVFGIEIVIIVVVAVIVVVMVVVVLVVVVVVVVAMAAIITAVIFDWKGKNHFLANGKKWMNGWMRGKSFCWVAAAGEIQAAILKTTGKLFH